MDERRDFERATDAALKYLRRLHETFGTWTLALAAYNCGGARLKDEIKEQKVRDYFHLNLPSETERFVYRIAAIKLIMEDPGSYGYRVPDKKIYRPVPHDAVRVTVKVPIHLTDLGKSLGTDLKALKDLNPQMQKEVIDRTEYLLADGAAVPYDPYPLPPPPEEGHVA